MEMGCERRPSCKETMEPVTTAPTSISSVSEVVAEVVAAGGKYNPDGNLLGRRNSCDGRVSV